MEETPPPRRDTSRPPPRRASAASAEPGGANANWRNGDGTEPLPAAGPDRPGPGAGREAPGGPGRLGPAARRMERRNSASQAVHQRYMPMEPLKLTIPRKAKEKTELFHVSTKSREYEDMMSVLTTSYMETTSSSCFTYSKPRLFHCDPLEKEFVEKRKEMKAEGRTEKELEESYCFLLAETAKLPLLCEKGLQVGHSRLTVLGNPTKGVYLSRYSDLLQASPINPGATGEIVIFKVMKGKVKSIYENMKNVLDPTPRFDSHTSKNASKVTALNQYRAYELTQQYFYEYSFDELRPRPRQVCPYAVVSFLFKGKDSSLPSMPLAPIRLNSQSERSKERLQFTVWSGDLVEGERLLFQISLRSFSPPFLPHRLPEKLQIGRWMKFDQLNKLLPSELLRYDVYSQGQEVVKHGRCCSLLEVVDRSRCTTSVSRLLTELEANRVVLVTPLSDRGFLLLLSSVLMAKPDERGETWKRSLQALFIFPESRDLPRPPVRTSSSSSHDASGSGDAVMPRLSHFLPALHHALVKARANPAPELSAGVERGARDYLEGQGEGKVRLYPMGEYESKAEDQQTSFLVPKHHQINMDSYLRTYLFNPAHYRLPVARARQVVEAHCGPEETQEEQELSRSRRRSSGGREEENNARDPQTNSQKMQQLIDLVLTCKRNAENEVRREGAGGGGGAAKAAGRKRKLEQETAERTLKYLKASQEHGPHGSKIPVEERLSPAPPGSLASVIGSVGLRDVDLREDGSELSARLLNLLAGLKQAARGGADKGGVGEEAEPTEACPFDRLATKLGLPTSCDIDLRKQDELEEQMAGSISSLEGFSPSSHSGESNHQGGAGGAGGGAGGGGGAGLRRRTGGYEEEEEVEREIPWILIPITGVCVPRYAPRDRNIPQDPRFQHLSTATAVAAATAPPRRTGSSPSPSPHPPLSPSPSPPPSPEPSPPHSPSQCPSPESSPAPSPRPAPPLAPRPRPPSQLLDPRLARRPPLSSLPSPGRPNELRAANEEQGGANEEAPTGPPTAPPTACRESAGETSEKKEEETDVSASFQPSTSPPPAEEEVTQSEEQPGPPAPRRPEEEEQQEVIDLTGVSSSTPSCVDGLVDKHLGDFSSELQLLLQEQSVHYAFPQSPHSTTAPPPPPPAPPAAFPSSISQFSQYVRFYQPVPPVQDYVSSLQDAISGVLTELDHSRQANANTNAGRTDAVQTDARRTADDVRTVDAALANTVSDFVSSIRLANAAPGRDEGTTREPISTQTADAIVTSSVSDDASILDAATATRTVRQTPDAITNSRTIRQTPGAIITANKTVWQTPDAVGAAKTAFCEATSSTPGSVSTSEPSHCSEPVSSPPSTSVPSGAPPRSEATPPPPPTAISSLISQLPPELFNNLVEIVKDVRRSSLQFYLHSPEEPDHVHSDVKDFLLGLGNTEQQSPVVFLNQGNPADKLLVVIRNKDITGHIDKIPGLVSLKRRASVMFVGVDSLDDLRNGSYNQLFVSGGCVVSDETILNPDTITPDQLVALLSVLEQHNSPHSSWTWKVHFKTHKKLKEQARFRRDASLLLDVLWSYQKRQLVDFLPYHHHCDSSHLKSPHLDCLLELQSRYTQHRHTVLLTENPLETYPLFCKRGITVANTEEILHNFSSLVGYHDNRERQNVLEHMLAPKALGSESTSGSGFSPSIFPDHMGPPLSSRDPPQHLLPSAPPSDQLVPDASTTTSSSSCSSSCKEALLPYSDMDIKVLKQAISQMRAQREQQQVERQDPRVGGQDPRVGGQDPRVGQLDLPPDASSTPPRSELVDLPHYRRAVATLEMIHSALQHEVEEDGGGGAASGGWRRREGGAGGGETSSGGWRRREGGAGGGETPSGGWSRREGGGGGGEMWRRREGGAGGDQRGGAPGSDASSSSANRSSAAASSVQPDSTNQHREVEVPQNSSTPPTPLAENSRTRDSQSDQEQPMREGAAQNKQHQPSPSQPGPGPGPGPPPRGGGLLQNPHLQNPHLQNPHLQNPHLQNPHLQNPHLQNPHLSRFPNQPFPHRPAMGPLAALGGGLLAQLAWGGHLPGQQPGPAPLGPVGAAALVWGFQQAGRDLGGPGLLGGFHHPAGQGSGGRYRGGPGGGGFNGM